MSPKWLTKHATIYGSYTYKYNYLDIPAGASLYEHVLQVPLVPPGVLANHGECVSVTMMIAMDTDWADSRDHDPMFGVSDGEKFIGFFTRNKGTTTPCYKVEGDDIKNKLSNIVADTTGHSLSSSSVGYSSEIKIQIKPCENWGSCHTEDEGGFVFIANYQRDLDLTKGLFLDMYRDSSPETYHIEYITVDVDKDDVTPIM